MYEYPLIFKKGHFFIETGGQKWLIDPGAPSSFGQQSQIKFVNKEFLISENYMGLSADLLSSYINVECNGLLGVDVLNKYDMIFDLDNNKLKVSNNELLIDGDRLPLSEFMGIPIVSVNIGDQTYKMFFDTGAKIAYLQDSAITTFQKLDNISDFYPGFGQLETETYGVKFKIGSKNYDLQCGSLPELLGMTLMMADAQGIMSNELLIGRVVGYYPRRGLLCLQT